MNVLEDYSYRDFRGHGEIVLRPTGRLAKDPAKALLLSQGLQQLLLYFTTQGAAMRYVLQGVYLPERGAMPDDGRLVLTAAVNRLSQLPVKPANYSFLAAPESIGKPTGHSLWLVGWPLHPQMEHKEIIRVLETSGLLPTLVFKQNDNDVWLLSEVAQQTIAKALQ